MGVQQIRCDAFRQHRCMKTPTKMDLACCHCCIKYDECAERCENKPRSCNVAHITQSTLYYPATSKRTNGMAKRVKQVDIATGEVIETYESVRLAAEALNLQRSNIASCARGEMEQYAGYQWIYADGRDYDKEFWGEE